MLGIIVTAAILFILIILYYNVSTNPDLFKIKKKEKPTKNQADDYEYIDPDLIPKKVSLKKEKKKEVKEEPLKETTYVEPIISDEENFEDNEQQINEDMFKKDFTDDLMFGFGLDDENEFLEDFSNLSPKMKALIITDIFKRKEW